MMNLPQLNSGERATFTCHGTWTNAFWLNCDTIVLTNCELAITYQGNAQPSITAILYEECDIIRLHVLEEHLHEPGFLIERANRNQPLYGFQKM